MEHRGHGRGIRFSINEEGALTFRSPPDYEAPNDANTDNIYEVTVRASDSDLMSSLNVEVTITDTNESGAITGPASVDYPENSTGTVATYSISDPDGDAVTWSIADTDAARFSISEEGALTFRSSPDYEAPNDANTNNVYEVTVRASDNGLSVHLERGGNRHGYQRIRRHHRPRVRELPRERHHHRRHLRSITDPDGDGVTWSVAGTDAARFSISSSGELSFRSSPDYEAPNDANTDNIYEVTVTCVGQRNLMSSLNVEVTITDTPTNPVPSPAPRP